MQSIGLARHFFLKVDMKHKLIFLFNGGQVTVKSWNRFMHPELLQSATAVAANQFFDSWEWASDGEAGMVAMPHGLDVCLMVVDNPKTGKEPCL